MNNRQLENYLIDKLYEDKDISYVDTFDNCGLLTRNQGVVIKFKNGDEFQVTIVKSMKQTAYNIRFSATVNISGDLQVKAASETEAQKIARLILRQNLNSEDCLIEIGEDDNSNNITVREMTLLPNITALDVQDAMPLD